MKNSGRDDLDDDLRSELLGSSTWVPRGRDPHCVHGADLRAAELTYELKQFAGGQAAHHHRALSRGVAGIDNADIKA